MSKKKLEIRANKTFLPPLTSPKVLTALVDPETTTCLQIKEFVFDHYEKRENFIPTCSSDLSLGGRSTSSFGAKDDSTLSNSIYPETQTDCCSSGKFSLDVSLNQGLPGGAANLGEEEKLFIVRSNNLEAAIHFKSFRLSCSSHAYSPEKIMEELYFTHTKDKLNGG